MALPPVVARPRHDDRSAELLSVASEVIGARGYVAASLQEIAGRMGILKGSLYHYARTKEELLYMILREGHRRGTATIEYHRRLPVILSGEPRLLSFIRVWMERGRYLEFGGLGGESHDYTLFLTAPHRAEIRGVRRLVADYLAEVIDSDGRSGFLRSDIDVGVASRSLLVIMNATHEWIDDYAEEWAEVSEWYVRLFSTGICSAEPLCSVAGDLSGNLAQRDTVVPVADFYAGSEDGRRDAEPTRGERWGELVDVASEVFGERTYPGASLAEIAKRMGIRKASLYHYIQTKEELLFELQKRAHEKGVALVREAAHDFAPSAKDRLARFIISWGDGLGRYNSAYVPLGKSDLQFMTEEHAATIRLMRRSIRRFVSDLIEEGVADGSFDPELNVRFVTNALLVSLNRSVRWFHGSRQGPSIGDWHVQLFLQGLASAEWRPQ